MNIKYYIENYLKSYLFLSDFFKDKIIFAKKRKIEDVKFAKTICFSTFKCMLLSNSVLFLFEFSKGKQHFTKYLFCLIKGTFFGYFYSVYYNESKLDDFYFQKYLENNRNELNLKNDL